MNRRHSKLIFVALLVSVTFLFFVHLPFGSFQSTNGPTAPVTEWRLLLLTLSAIFSCSALFQQTNGMKPLMSSARTLQADPVSPPLIADVTLRC